MARNQLPDGVGKKIVEALKRQAEADITPVSEYDNSVSNTIPLTNINSVEELQFDGENKETEEFDNLIVEEDVPSLTIEQPEPLVQQEIKIEQPKKEEIKEPVYVQPVKTEPKVQEVVPPVINEIPEIQPKPQFVSRPEVNIQREQISQYQSSGHINIPANVATLRNLIAGLPVGVTKQTGAQIIRQTLEAMGIPMNGVLKEAQEVQEELNSSTRECLLKIQEYKTNILQLEQSVQEYQKSINQINDLVSLFLLTDK